ncbi:MAG: hypothetical protein ACYCWW_19390, partial [Deltaproteobacteria bacterium]
PSGRRRELPPALWTTDVEATMPSAKELKPQIEELAQRCAADVVRTRHEAHLADPTTADDVHTACASSKRCLAAGPSDVPEDIWQRLEDELLSQHFSEDDFDSDDHTDCTDAFAAAFSRAWQAQVKPCK